MTKTEIKIVLISFAAFAAAILIALSKDAEAAPTPPATKFYWSHSDQLTDGSQATLQGFKIYCGISPASYTIEYTVASGVVRSELISNVLDTGKYYCAMTAFSAEGESGYSNELFLDVTSGVVKPLVPEAPGNFRIGS